MCDGKNIRVVLITPDHVTLVVSIRPAALGYSTTGDDELLQQSRAA
jgi:hypothetical protein